jgi:hypothetical protein
MTRAYGAEQLTLEPDCARERAIGLIRDAVPFVVEMTTTVRHMKDVVCLAIGGEFQEEPEKYDYIRLRATHREEACQAVWNWINAELSFAVRPERVNGDNLEWVMVARMPKR